MISLEERGQKRVCIACGCHFYDLNNAPIKCPKCSSVLDPRMWLKMHRLKTTKENKKHHADDILASEDHSLEEDGLLDVLDEINDDIAGSIEFDKE